MAVRNQLIVLSVALLTCQCTHWYREPVLPVNQAALVMVDARARVEEIDGLTLDGRRGPARAKFWVTATCHDLTTKFEDSFVISHGASAVVMFAFGGVTGLAVAAARTEVHSYETDMPIRFHVPAKAGMKYWLTSTFNGDQFSPRISVLDATDQRVAVILPNQPCSATTALPQ